MNSTMEVIFGLLGGLAVFIFGMNMMSDCLQKAAGERMKSILALLTKNPVLGVIAGALTTAVLQSSSATTVMAIGFVSAGLMNLPQAISIILGANIGTTMTAQIIAFKLSDYIYIIIFIGFIISFVVKSEKAKNIGQTIFAFGLLFLGIETMGSVMAELSKRGVNARLDFYGQVEGCDKNHFELFIESNENIEYKGYLSPENIHETLGHYDVMVFPTQYYTEGFPGTVLDANIAGIPVIATNWKHAHEFIADKHSGIVVDFDNPTQGFVESIEYLYKDNDALLQMKHEARAESNKYSEDSAWSILSKYLE